jgi:hypothetical protein
MREIQVVFRFSLRALAVAVTGAACSTGTVVKPVPPPIDYRSLDERRVADAGAAAPTARERAVAEAYLAGLASPGFGPLSGHLTADVHFSFPGLEKPAGDAFGAPAVVRAQEVLFGAFEPRSLAASRVLRTASAQIVEWTLAGPQKSDWLGVPATEPKSRTVSFRGVSILGTKDDGSISDVRTLFDVASVKAQLRAGPGEPRDVESPAMPDGGLQVEEQDGSPEEAQNVAAVRGSLDALERSRDAYIAAMDPEARVVALRTTSSPRGNGREGAAAYYKALHEAIAQLDTTVESAWGVGHFAVAEYTISGEQIGPLFGFALQRDKVVRLHVIDVVELAAGKIAKIWRYDNPVEISR